MKYVVLGTGIAGLTAAITIRENDSNCEIVMVGDEKYLSYSRPMITKAPLKGFDVSKFIIKDEAWYQEHNIKIVTGAKVTSIEANSKTIILSNGDTLVYDKCIYALGAKSFIPPIKGADHDIVTVVRTIDDVAKLRTKMLTAKKAVVVGGGVVGLEMAWELKKVGMEVVILEASKHLMGGLLDEQSADVFESKIESVGIKIYTEVDIDVIGYNNQVVLKDGNSFPADLVILSCGIAANTDVAIKAGIAVNRAVVVNDKMETSVKDIYACGDCAEYNGSNYALWQQAISQAQVAGANSCNKNVKYKDIERFILFNGANTSLFAMGDFTSEKVSVHTYDDVCKKEFLVNERMETKNSYEKYFHIQGKIVGGVLIGDLSKMAKLKKSINETNNWLEVYDVSR